MMNIIKKSLGVINVIFLILTMIFIVYGIYEQIMGPAGAEALLKKLRIPLTYNQVLIIGFVCIVLMIVTYILKAKVSGGL